ncbi:MAG: hypothetical protein PVS2B2_24650 [Candidatus Acidiferrum sp.]
MAGIAAHAIDAVAVSTAFDVLHVDMAIVALERRIARGMTILTARRDKDFVNLQKGVARSTGVRLRRVR